MRHPFLYLVLAAGLVCWGLTPSLAKDDDKQLSKAEKRELKKKEKEAKKAARKKALKGDKADADEQVDKKAFSKFLKQIAPFTGKIKTSSKFYLLACYNNNLEASEALLQAIQENEASLKRGKIGVLLINAGDALEEKEAVKELKRYKLKHAAVFNEDWKKETEKILEVTGDNAISKKFSSPAAAKWTLLTPSGEALGTGDGSSMEDCFKLAGVKATPVKAKADKEDGDAEEEESED